MYIVIFEAQIGKNNIFTYLSFNINFQTCLLFFYLSIQLNFFIVDTELLALTTSCNTQKNSILTKFVNILQ